MTLPNQENATAAKPQRPRLTPAQQLAQLDAKRQRLAAQVQKAERDRRTRQMVLIGVAVAKAMEDDPVFGQRVRAVLDSHTTRKIDREALAPWLPPTSTPD